MTVKQKLRIVVCGSTFGQFYLEALRRLPEVFDLVGLLAQGSERSVRCAAYYNVPLYRNVEQLPGDIDAACVVLRSGIMGGKGTELALQFLERGVSVIQEQPVHCHDIEVCLKTAHRQGVFFQVGDLYVHLPAVKRLISATQALLQRQMPLYIDAAFACQVSYPMMDIFSKLLPSIRPWKTGSVNRDGGPFHVITATIGETPLIFRVHNEIDPVDPDNYLHLLHRVTIGCEAGSMTLTDTHGFVVWQPRLHIPKQGVLLGALADGEADHLAENSSEVLSSTACGNYREIFTKHWPDAIGCDLLHMRAAVLGIENTTAHAQRQLLCAAQWHKMTAALGYPVLRTGRRHQALPLDWLAGIREAAPL